MSSWKERIEAELELCSGSAKHENWYKVVEKITDIIDTHPDESCKVAIDLVLKSWNWKPWSPIKLTDENFSSITGRHYRTWYIQKDDKGIFNVLSYFSKIRRCYVVEGENNVKEIEKGILDKNGDFIDERMYISRGGIINGDYIHKCYLKNQTDDYSIKDPIKVPVSSIEFKDSPNVIFFVDHREPKLKALMEFYNVPMEHSDNVKFNVRTFKKLK